MIGPARYTWDILCVSIYICILYMKTYKESFHVFLFLFLGHRLRRRATLEARTRHDRPGALYVKHSYIYSSISVYSIWKHIRRDFFIFLGHRLRRRAASEASTRHDRPGALYLGNPGYAHPGTERLRVPAPVEPARRLLRHQVCVYIYIYTYMYIYIYIYIYIYEQTYR